MSASAAGRFEEIARTARRVQNAIEEVRGAAASTGVRIEVAADGRITALELADPALAQALSAAHAEAVRQAADQVVSLRRELVADPTISAALQRFIGIEAESADCARRPTAGGAPSPATAPPRHPTAGDPPPPAGVPPSATAALGQSAPGAQGGQAQPHPPPRQPTRSAPLHPRQPPAEDHDDTDENPHALPPHIRRRYGL
ncbi:hypothetical protein [Nocardia sp. CC227C]|uniref:hypothetical protein n=1 Tax=Nocardia sp. CC227C TaxID=3044562 RepID=UPI00278C4B67|nr:hypothetical protein [Nocardia sp. CC227C]